MVVSLHIVSHSHILGIVGGRGAPQRSFAQGPKNLNPALGGSVSFTSHMYKNQIIVLHSNETKFYSLIVRSGPLTQHGQKLSVRKSSFCRTEHISTK